MTPLAGKQLYIPTGAIDYREGRDPLYNIYH